MGHGRDANRGGRRRISAERSRRGAGALASGAAAIGLVLGLDDAVRALPPALVVPRVEPGAPVALRSRELLVVDGRLGYAAALVRGARPSVDALILDPTRDGVAQITEALRGRRDVAAVHLVAHGEPGRVHLGASELSNETLGRYREALSTWFAATAPFERRPDLLVYGCSAGAGDEGARFLERLAALTGADVAGSDDLTGPSSAGGDFALEIATGAIEARLPVASAVAERVVEGTLETFTVTSSADDGPGSLRAAVAEANALEGVDDVVFDLPLPDAGAPLAITLTTGAIVISEGVSIVGPGADALTIDADDTDSVFRVERRVDFGYYSYTRYDVEGEVTIEGLTLTGGYADESGGAIFAYDASVTVDSCVLTGNFAPEDGGAIFHYNGTLAVVDSHVVGNQAYDEGGGVAAYGYTTILRSVISGNHAYDEGGGLAAFSSLYLRDSLVADNDATESGGGVLADGFLTEIVNSTVSGNSAGYLGGGVAVEFGNVRIDSSTITGNTGVGYVSRTYGPYGPYVFAAQSGGVTILRGRSAIVLDSIIHGNRGGTGDPDDGLAPMDLVVAPGGFVFSDSTIMGVVDGDLFDPTGSTQIGVDPLLGALADNGGVTETHALAANSPALDRGTNPRGLEFDQRGSGFARVSGAAADLGAFELQGGDSTGDGCGCDAAGTSTKGSPAGTAGLFAGLLGAVALRRRRTRDRESP